MSYGKDDFLDWDDDIDLDSLLGEYTCSEIELTDDDEPSKKKQKTKNAKSENMSENVSAKAKTYRCSECQNSYASISGLRGHLRNKHGITNVKGTNTIFFFSFLLMWRNGLRTFITQVHVETLSTLPGSVVNAHNFTSNMKKKPP